MLPVSVSPAFKGSGLCVLDLGLLLCWLSGTLSEGPCDRDPLIMSQKPPFMIHYVRKFLIYSEEWVTELDYNPTRT